MKEGINLSLTKSLSVFDKLIDKVIKEVTAKKLLVSPELEEANIWKFQVGKYIRIDANDEEDPPVFWIGYGWEEKGKSCIWLEFDAKTCPENYWEKLNKLVGSTGKYYSEIDFEFTHVYMNAWIHFYLKQEFLKQFFDTDIELSEQKEILTGFISEVMEKI